MSDVVSAALGPMSFEAEQMILGSLLVDGSAWERIGALSAEDFASATHAAIFTAARASHLDGDATDVVMVAQRLADVGDLDRVGGLVFLGQLAAAVPTTGNVARYAEIVSKRAKLRALMGAAAEIADACRDVAADPNERAEHALSLIASIVDGKHYGGMQPFAEVVGDTVARALAGERTLFSGMFPVRDVERVYGKLEPGQLIVVAARPAMGKTVFGLQSALMASLVGHLALVFELEMSGHGLANRALSAWSGIPLKDIRFGDVTASAAALKSAQVKLERLPLQINTTPALHVDQLRAQCRAISRRQDVRLIVVDHLGLLRGEGRDKYQQTGYVSNTLKVIAKENNAVVMALVQLNRSVEGRTNRRPELSDLRDSGEIEQDADGVIMLYRDDYYNPESPASGVLEAIVRKNRDGALGTAYAKTAFQWSRLDDQPDGFMPPSSGGRGKFARDDGF